MPSRGEPSRGPSCPGPFATAPIVVSVAGADHASSGGDVLLSYKAPITNEGGAWLPGDGGSAFAAPCRGLYLFAISFTKDAFPNLCAQGFTGTEDDVFMTIKKNNGTQSGSAWSGESSGKRSTGVYTVALRLKRGDVINTWTSSDVGKPRCLKKFYFTGYRIGD